MGKLDHSWMLDVFEDLEAYATENNLEQIAADMAIQKMRAQREIAGCQNVVARKMPDKKCLFVVP